MRRLAAVALLITGYLIASGLSLLPDPPFGRPGDIASFVQGQPFLSLLLRDTTSTVITVLGSWIAGSVAGIAAGLIVALGMPRTTALTGTLEFLRSIPSVMWVPVGITVWGLGAKQALVVTSFVVFLFMASEVAYSQYVFARLRREHLKRLGLSFVQRVRVAHVFEVLTVALPAARVALTIALVVTVIAEMSGGSRWGLGARMLSYQASQRGDGLVCVMLLAGVIGTTLNALMEQLETHVLPWQHKGDLR